MVIFWLSVANSFLSSAEVNLHCPSSQEWFLLAWLAHWSAHLGLCCRWCRLFCTTLGFQDEKRSRWLFLFSAVFWSCLSWASNSYQQGTLLTCLQLSLYCRYSLLERSSISTCSFPWRAVSLPLPFSLCDFRAVKPWTWSNSRIPPQMQHLQEPTEVQLCYPASWFIALFLPVHLPVYHIRQLLFFMLHMHICAQCKNMADLLLLFLHVLCTPKVCSCFKLLWYIKIYILSFQI